MSSFSKQATVTASTKRATLSGGKKGTPTTFISSFKCTPLDPVDAEVQQRLQLQGGHEVLQTFVEGSIDIKEGDVLVVGEVEYPIRAVGNWTWKSTVYRHLVIEELKR